MTDRLADCFARCREEGRAALVTYVMAGDPDPETSLEVLKALPAAGADIVEFGMPFSDPLADGPAIQEAALRALSHDIPLQRTLAMVRDFRKSDPATPIVLMGYFNPIYSYGAERFVADAREAGVDALIVVDLPPEMDDELTIMALAAGLKPIRLVTPTSDDKRLVKVLQNTGGFLYYVSIKGITGAAIADFGPVRASVEHLKTKTDLPVAVGFGIKTPQDARTVAAFADAVVVGSALVSAAGKAGKDAPSAVADVVRELAAALRKGA